MANKKEVYDTEKAQIVGWPKFSENTASTHLQVARCGKRVRKRREWSFKQKLDEKLSKQAVDRHKHVLECPNSDKNWSMKKEETPGELPKIKCEKFQRRVVGVPVLL